MSRARAGADDDSTQNDGRAGVCWPWQGFAVSWRGHYCGRMAPHLDQSFAKFGAAFLAWALGEQAQRDADPGTLLKIDARHWPASLPGDPRPTEREVEDVVEFARLQRWISTAPLTQFDTPGADQRARGWMRSPVFTLTTEGRQEAARAAAEGRNYKPSAGS